MEIENAKRARAICYSIQLNLNSMLFICEPLGQLTVGLIGGTKDCQTSRLRFFFSNKDI